jgi:VWFA-related protein
VEERVRTQTIVLLSILAGLTITTAPAVAARGGQNPPQQPPPVFRAGVTLIPVDVRVVDSTGKPVTDLKAEDFTIVEDGVKQEIRHFALQTFAAAPAPAPPKDGLTLREEPLSFDYQTNRIFLIVLGRGKLQEPSKAIDALLGFVRTNMLPQDQVAVFAYNRATTFTTDHQKIARLLERFKAAHEEIDFKVEQQMMGLAAIYGSKLIPKELQGRIDKMFEGSGLLASARLEPGAPADNRIEADARRQIDAQIRQQEEAARAEGAALSGVQNISIWSGLDEVQTQMFADLSLEDFVATTATTLQDLGNIYAAIDYLRHFEGEKHVVYFTEKGLTLPRLEEDEILAATANDARVVLDTVETGGLYSAQKDGSAGPDGRWNQTFAFKTLRTIAELTGGVSSIAEKGATAMNRLNDVTRATYSLGFYPSNAYWNGAYRKVTVKVARPGTTVYYRHGYYARKELAAFNRREFITSDRLKAAARFRRTINDIRVKLDAGIKRSSDGTFELTVDVKIDPKNLAFQFVEGYHLGKLTVGVFLFGESGNGLGGGEQNADVKLADDVYKKVLGSGIPFKATFPVPSGVRRVRVVVYDFKADLVGSTDQFVL